MLTPNDIVDILLEDEGEDLDAFIASAGVLSPGVELAQSFASLKSAVQDLAAQGKDVASAKGWFYTPTVRFGDGRYEVHANVFTQKAQVIVNATLPPDVKSSFNIYDGMQSVEFRRSVATDLNPENIRAAADKLYEWTTAQMQKWKDLAYIRRMARKVPSEVNYEFRQTFPNLKAMAGFEHNGYAKSPVTNREAARMAAWMRARAAQIKEGIEEINLDEFLRDAGVTVEPEDFIMDGHRIGYPGAWTGNYTYYIHYKRILHKGKPVYLGSITACHDYNRTGHGGHVFFYVNVPTRRWTYDPRDKQGRRVYKYPQSRQNYGYGAVHMNPPASSHTSVGSLFDGAKLLLSLLKIQPPLKHREESGS